MKVKLEATIPTTQYGNIRPTFELEEEGDDVKAYEELTRMWSRFGEVPLKVKTDLGELVTTFTGEEVYYNDDTHTYHDKEGNELLSGSNYAKQFAKPFDEQVISKAVANKTGEKQEDILAKWKLGGSVANHFGTAVHDAVEFRLNGGDSEKIPAPIQEMVHRLYSQVEAYKMDIHTEVVISDVKNKAVGRVDCLLTDGDEFIIVDYKTNRELKDDKIEVYTKQLEYYRDIMLAHGWLCNGLVILHDDGNELTTHKLDS